MADEMLTGPDTTPDPALGGALDQIQPLFDKPFAQEPVKLSPDEVNQLWRRIDAGIEFQKREFTPTYRDALRLWEGKHWPEGRGNDHYDGTLVINMIPNVIRSLVESTAFQTPDFTLTPWNRQGESNQQIAKAALKYWWKEARVQQELKRVAYDAKLFGLGVCQVGWLFKTETTKRDEGRLEVLPEGMPVSGVALAQELGLLAPGESPDDFVEADDVIEDRFACWRINPMDVILPPNATASVDDWAWVCKIERRPLAEVKGDKQFANTRNLKGSTKANEPYLSEDLAKLDEADRPPDVRYVELFHYYERDRRLHVVLTRENRTKPLKTEKWSWESRRYPFRVLANNALPDRIYGKSVPVELWDQQIELNETRTQNMLHRRQFNRMFLVPQGALDRKNLNLMYQGEAGTVIEYTPGIGELPQPLQHPQLQQETYKSYEWAIQGIEQLSGLSQYALHAPASKRLSATESQNIANAGGVLFLADAAAFTTLCEQVAEDLLDWTQQYAQVVRELPIFDESTNVADWVDMDGDDIRGDWLVTVAVNSTQPPDAQSQLQEQQLTLQTLVEAMQLAQESGGQVPRPLAIVIRRMLEIIGVRDVDSLLPLPPLSPPPSGPGPGMAPAGPPPSSGPGGPPPGAPPPGMGPYGPTGPPPVGAGAPPPITMNQATLQQVINSLPPEVLAQILQGGS